MRERVQFSHDVDALSCVVFESGVKVFESDDNHVDVLKFVSRQILLRLLVVSAVAVHIQLPSNTVALLSISYGQPASIFLFGWRCTSLLNDD